MNVDLVRLDLAHNGDVHVFDCRDTNDKTRTEDGGDKDRVGDLSRNSRRRAKRWGGDGFTGKAVDDACDDNVDDDFEGLLHEEGGWELFLRIAHLGHDGHERLIAGEGKGDVEEGVDGLDKGWFADKGNLDVETRGRFRSCDTEGNHNDENRGDNRNRADPAHGSRECKLAWQTEQPTGNVRDGHESNCADGVRRNRVKRNRHCDVCTGANEDQIEDERNAEEILERLSTDVKRTIDQVGDHGVSPVELDHDVAAVGCEQAETKDSDDARDESERLERRRQAENTNTDFDGDQNYTRAPTAQCPILLAETISLLRILVGTSKAVTRPTSCDVGVLSILFVVG